MEAARAHPSFYESACSISPLSCAFLLFKKKCDVASLFSWFPSYTGQRGVSNMLIVQIKMLSGYIPVKSTIKLVKTFFLPSKEFLLLVTKLGLEKLRTTL